MVEGCFEAQEPRGQVFNSLMPLCFNLDRIVSFLALMCQFPVLLLRFAGMGASLLFGTMGDSISRAWSGSGTGSTGGTSGAVYSSVITEANAERLANALCRCVVGCHRSLNFS